MPRYAVGDLQGCLQPLQHLLERVQFDPAVDELWLVGDLCNRGPDSLGTLRFVKSLGSAAKVVLGNHDLHLLAVSLGYRKLKRKDTFRDVLEAPDHQELFGWLRHLPLLHEGPRFDSTATSDRYLMVHAGIPPQWSTEQARARARELEEVLRGPRIGEYFDSMYGNAPNGWSDELEGGARWRVITNYFTRMRFCDAEGILDLDAKGGLDSAPPGMKPWFAHASRRASDVRIIFGHWAMLEGRTGDANVCGLDTACVWGQSLTMMRLGDEQRFNCDCSRFRLHPGV